jgi:protein-S-isoprenylcysteine O-methyltransferase Ste14
MSDLTIQLAVFLVLSALLLLFTLKRRHRHRFYRFGAFECVLALVLLNAGRWFVDPFSGLQLLSWPLLAGSFALAAHAVALLHSAAPPGADIEETTSLVTRGAYRYIRHPLYCSLLLLGLGAFLKAPSLPGLLLLALLAAFAFVTAHVEEPHNLERFGQAYRDYRLRTKMFIPFLV